MIYNFKVDSLIKCWERVYCEVEADTLEEAIDLVKNEDFRCLDSEIFYETIELIDPEDNDNNATVEIFYDNNLVHSNEI